MTMYREDWWFASFYGAVLFVVIALITWAVRDTAAHLARGCKTVHTGQYVTTIVPISSGKVTTFVPITEEVLCWSCPDGEP